MMRLNIGPRNFEKRIIFFEIFIEAVSSNYTVHTIFRVVQQLEVELLKIVSYAYCDVKNYN